MTIEEYKTGLDKYQEYLDLKEKLDAIIEYLEDNENDLRIDLRTKIGYHYYLYLTDEEVNTILNRMKNEVTELKAHLLEKYKIEVEE